MLAALVAAAAALVVAFPTGGTAAQSAIRTVDITDRSKIVTESFAVAGPNDPNRCVVDFYVEFPDIAGAVSYTALILNSGFNPPREQTFGATPPSFPWDEVTYTLYGQTRTATAPPGSHRILLAGSSSGSGCAGESWVSIISVSASVEGDQEPPVASFTWEARDGEPLTIDVDASASTDDGPIASYSWDFGDDGTGTGERTDHTFSAGGSYPVTLTVTDADGLTDSQTQNVEVSCASGESSTQSAAGRQGPHVLAAGDTCELELTLTAQPPRPQGVRRTERIDYSLGARVLDAGCGCPLEGEVAELELSVTLRPDLVQVDPDSITGGGTLSSDGSTIAWELTGVDAVDPPLTFSATVKESAPRTILFVSAQARGSASLVSGARVATSRITQVPLLQFGLELGGEIVSDRGDHVLPGDVATVRLQADARQQADEIVLEARVPKGSNLVDGSITGGGVRDGERTIRWRFADVALTPIVGFRVKVDPLKDLPKELKRLEAATSAEATIDGVPERGEKTLSIDVVRPTTIRGVVHDIVPLYPQFAAVNDGKVLGGVPVWLVDSEGRKVDETTSTPGGEFALEAGKPGRYTLEARADASGKAVPARHVIVVESETRASIDGRPIAERDDVLQPVDIYTPVSLVRQTVELIEAIRTFEIDYYFVLGFDLRGALPKPGGLLSYDVAAAEAALSQALALGYTNPDGTLAHYRGLYAGSGDRDGWNALIRLNAFLTQFEKRVKEAATLADLAAKPLALYITVEMIKVLFEKRQLASNEKLWKAFKIGFMAEGIGLVVPQVVLPWLGIEGKEKAMWMEVLAKGSRYGMNGIADVAGRSSGRTRLPGAWPEDLTFELIYNVIRMGYIAAVVEFYIAGSPLPGDGTQDDLDEISRLLRLGVYSGATVDVLARLDTVDARALGRLRTLSGVSANVNLGISTIRGVDGTLFFGGGALPGVFAAAAGRVNKVTSWLSKYVVGPTLVTLCGTSIIAVECQMNDVSNLSSVTLNGVDLGDCGLPTRFGGTAVASPGDGRRSLASTSSTAAPTTTRATPARRTRLVVAALDRTLGGVAAEAQRIRKLVGAGALATVREREPALVDAHVALLGTLVPWGERASLAAASAKEPAVTALRSFTLARSSLANAVLRAHATLGEWEASPSTTTAGAAAREALALLATEATRLRALARRAAKHLARALPAGLAIRGETVPDDTAVVSGKPFTYGVTIVNPGDRRSRPATAELSTGEALTVAAPATRPVKALAPGESITIRWRLRAAAPRANRMLVDLVQVRLKQGGAIVRSTDDVLVAAG